MKLNKSTAHLWIVDTTIRTLPHYLSASETERWKNFYFSKDRHTYFQSHNALRLILSHYLTEKPDKIEYKNTTFGKPLLKNSRLQFNLSHVDKMAVIAVTEEAEIGVDIENMNRKVEYEDLARRFFSDTEYQKLLQAASIKHAFFSCWTRKEAFIKAIGEGLSYPLHDFEVTFLSDEPVQINHIKQCNASAKDWTLDSRTFDDYIIATAVKHPQSVVNTLDFKQLLQQ